MGQSLIQHVCHIARCMRSQHEVEDFWCFYTLLEASTREQEWSFVLLPVSS